MEPLEEVLVYTYVVRGKGIDSHGFLNVRDACSFAMSEAMNFKRLITVTVDIETHENGITTERRVEIVSIKGNIFRAI